MPVFPLVEIPQSEISRDAGGGHCKFHHHHINVIGVLDITLSVSKKNEIFTSHRMAWDAAPAYCSTLHPVRYARDRAHWSQRQTQSLFIFKLDCQRSQRQTQSFFIFKLDCQHAKGITARTNFGFVHADCIRDFKGSQHTSRNKGQQWVVALT